MLLWPVRKSHTFSHSENNSDTEGSNFVWRIYKKGSYRHWVEEQAHESHQQSNDQELDQTHLVVIPQHVLQRLERVHEPRESWIRTAERNRHLKWVKWKVTEQARFLGFVTLVWSYVHVNLRHRIFEVKSSHLCCHCLFGLIKTGRLQQTHTSQWNKQTKKRAPTQTCILPSGE